MCLLLQDDPSYNLFWETAPTEHWHAFEDEAWVGRSRPCQILVVATVQALYACAICNSLKSPDWQTDMTDLAVCLDQEVVLSKHPSFTVEAQKLETQ